MNEAQSAERPFEYSDQECVWLLEIFRNKDTWLSQDRLTSGGDSTVLGEFLLKFAEDPWTQGRFEVALSDNGAVSRWRTVQVEGDGETDSDFRQQVTALYAERKGAAHAAAGATPAGQTGAAVPRSHTKAMMDERGSEGLENLLPVTQKADARTAISMPYDGPNCIGQEPEMFYAEKGGFNAAARLICSRCAVLTPCLESSMSTEQEQGGYRFGIIGGLSAQERRQVQEKIDECGEASGQVLVRELWGKAFARALKMYRGGGISVMLQAEGHHEEVLDQSEQIAS